MKELIDLGEGIVHLHMQYEVLLFMVFCGFWVEMYFILGLNIGSFYTVKFIGLTDVMGLDFFLQIQFRANCKLSLCANYFLLENAEIVLMIFRNTKDTFSIFYYKIILLWECTFYSALWSLCHLNLFAPFCNKLIQGQILQIWKSGQTHLFQ